MEDLCEASRIWSARRTKKALKTVQSEAKRLASQLPVSGQVILSSEDLTGHMPGRKKLRSYDAAPTLMETLENAIMNHHPSAEITFYFSTRGAAAWLRSCHWQHVRATPYKLSVEDYARQYAGSADLDTTVKAVASGVVSRVESALLEDCTGEWGPSEPVLDLADVPKGLRAQLKHIKPSNVAASDEILAAMLQLKPIRVAR